MKLTISIEQIIACPSLPSLPAVAMEVLELTRDSDVELSAIARVVERDPALSAKILKTVNSSYYALTRPCPTIDRALAYLGLSTVKSLVLGFSLMEVSHGVGDLDLTAFWQRSLTAAAAARRLASRIQTCDRDEAFIGALMQDIGMLAMFAGIGAEYSDFVRSSGVEHHGLAEVERAELGFGHPEVGLELARKWRLPAQLAEVIRFHHEPESARYPTLTRTVALAGLCAGAMTGARSASAVRDLREAAEELMDLSQEALGEVLTAVGAEVQELGELFNVDVRGVEMNHLLAEAEELQIQQQLEAERESDRLRETNENLVRRATTDALTQVGNRGRFDEELVTQLQQARMYKGALGVIICDADHFKNVNDTYGHSVGDAVLVELARRLGETVRGTDTVCRYGGEEFAVILPGANRKTVAIIAERLRRSLADALFDVSNASDAVETIPVTASFGAAVFDEGTAQLLDTTQRLIEFADRALYAAKEAGRNCVRVFNPPTASAAAA